MGRPLRIDGLPCRREPLVKPDFFPDLEALFTAERASLDVAVDAAVGKAVCVTGVVESGGRGGLIRDLEMGGWERDGRLFEVDELLEVKVICHGLEVYVMSGNGILGLATQLFKLDYKA